LRLFGKYQKRFGSNEKFEIFFPTLLDAKNNISFFFRFAMKKSLEKEKLRKVPTIV